MSGSSGFIDALEIREGKLGEFEEAAREVVEFAEANEPRLLACNVYTNEEGAQATGLQIHPDSESIEIHIKLAGSTFGKIVEPIETARTRVYGKPSDRVLKRMQQMRQMPRRRL